MTEYISREAVINITAETGAWETQNRIRELPATDVQPIRHGRWIDHEKFERKNCNACIECSVCNTWFGHDCIPKTKFCPNCGARMDIIYEDDKIRAIKVTG